MREECFGPDDWGLYVVSNPEGMVTNDQRLASFAELQELFG
jgi:hypothetical protein